MKQCFFPINFCNKSSSHELSGNFTTKYLINYFGSQRSWLTTRHHLHNFLLLKKEQEIKMTNFSFYAEEVQKK